MTASQNLTLESRAFRSSSPRQPCPCLQAAQLAGAGVGGGENQLSISFCSFVGKKVEPGMQRVSKVLPETVTQSVTGLVHESPRVSAGESTGHGSLSGPRIPRARP